MLTHPDRFVAFAARAAHGLLLAVSLLACAAHADDLPRTGGPYVPTPQEVVDRMLQLAEVGPRDFVLDLGSGDGRMVLTAARRYGARGLGVDIDPALVALSRAEAARLGIADRVQFRVEDVTHTPLGAASVVTLYLLPGLTRALAPRLLAELAPGARIVAHDFDLGEWKADRELTVDVTEKYGTPGTWKSMLYLWTVPARIAGWWHMEIADARTEHMLLRLDQRFQHADGTALRSRTSLALSAGRIDGTHVQFRLAAPGARSTLYTGVVDGDTMRGTAETEGARVSWSAVRVASAAAQP